MNRIITLLFLSLLLWNCQLQNKPKTYVFDPPQIEDKEQYDIDSLPFFETEIMQVASTGYEKIISNDSLRARYNHFIDSVYNSYEEEDEEEWFDPIDTLISYRPSIIIDTTRAISYQVSKWHSYKLPTFSYGKEIYPQRHLSPSVYEDVKGYRVWVANLSDSIKYILTQDGDIMAIQEALTPEGKWKPIEYWAHSWCGNSIKPNPLSGLTYTYFTMPIYKGEYKTKIRLKVNNEEEILYSNVIEGTINLKQFQEPSEFVLPRYNARKKKGSWYGYIYFNEPDTIDVL
ncbi:hypothetical protein [Flammeovirga sp. EKP202]|uniref:hypothetical protein n=1 Tax=Flammeovirga sp. EKP202 TaxID=2770592 RepID=UPI00165EF07E|nr:hypothetical protein [Flammeovirga sp. EKP202]MBD0400080.1 hypothetical protein [Flammeovirga sp. EKP202]